MLRLALVLMMACFAISAHAAEPRVRQVAYDAFFLKNSLANKQQLAEVLEQNNQKLLKVSPEHLVRILGNEHVPEANSVQTFVKFLRSAQVFEVACLDYNRPGTKMYRVSTGGQQTDSTWSRPCYAGERWLAYKDSQGGVVPFLSLSCGNPLRYVPPVRAAKEDCVEVVVHLVPGPGAPTAPQGRPYLRVWGNYTTAGCGLIVTTCVECVNVLGQPAAAFYAPPIAGKGVIRLPRGMVVGLVQICVEVQGFTTASGTPSKILGEDLAAKAREAAKAGLAQVLPPGAWLEFRYVRS